MGIKCEDLADINLNVRKMIINFMNEKSMSLNLFSKKSGCNQNQLWLYLYSGDSKKGLHTATLEKIGSFLIENK